MNHTHLSLNNKAVQQLKELCDKNGATKTSTVEQAISEKWNVEISISFNDACTELGITAEREPFHKYWAKVRDDQCQKNTAAVWETIYKCYEDSRDSADLRATQQDALR